MNLIERFQNIWKLGEYKPTENTGDLIVQDTKTAVLVKKPMPKQETVFIPRVKRDAIQELVNEDIHE